MACRGARPQACRVGIPADVGPPHHLAGANLPARGRPPPPCYALVLPSIYMPSLTQFRRYELIVLAAAALIYLGSSVSPPSLMDDVDAVQAQIARNMLDSGDWVSARLDGVLYLEKSPLKYWMIACSYAIFGVHDWAARIPVALAAVALCWLVFRMGAWAFSLQAGLWSGLAMATGIGLFLFTRILIPDVVLTFTIALAMWSFLRALDEYTDRPRLWAALMAAAIGTGLLLKGLIAAVFPIAAALLYLAVSGQILRRDAWRRLHIPSGILIALAIAVPWHVLATLRNPPYFVWSLHSGPGQWKGFFWFYFFNEHLLRFLNLRYPRDYNTVPRAAFWLLHLVWLFPWSVYLPAAARLGYRPVDRAGRMRLLALCWVGFVLLFFTFSTTQEYYSMPCYPALALIIGSAVAAQGRWAAAGVRVAASVALAAALAIAFILSQVWSLPAPGDISRALEQHPEVYTLSLGHMGDLTLASFAYLRPPLILAGVAFLGGGLGAWLLRGPRAAFALAAMMVLFLHAARLAMVTFDPYLSSRPLAEALNQAPPGRIVLDDSYYTFSSIPFYTGRPVLLLNGRVNNLEYGSNAPGAPAVFLDDAGFARLWRAPQRVYIAADRSALPRLERLVGRPLLNTVREAGGKLVLSNQAP
jgi:4-amino-4-deoxy-L-arabinose transferase-like glycosyltransferase